MNMLLFFLVHAVDDTLSSVYLPTRKHWSVRPKEYKVDWCQSVVSRYAILSFTDNRPQTSFGGLRGILSINEHCILFLGSKSPNFKTIKSQYPHGTRLPQAISADQPQYSHEEGVCIDNIRPRRRRDWLFDAPNLE